MNKPLRVWNCHEKSSDLILLISEDELRCLLLQPKADLQNQSLGMMCELNRIIFSSKLRSSVLAERIQSEIKVDIRVKHLITTLTKMKCV